MACPVNTPAGGAGVPFRDSGNGARGYEVSSESRGRLRLKSAVLKALHNYDEARKKRRLASGPSFNFDDEKHLINDAASELEKTLPKMSSFDVAYVLFEEILLFRSANEGKKNLLASRRRAEIIVKKNAIAAAKARHAKSGAGTVKKEVQRYWLAWQTQHPDRHKSASAFALVMLDKYPDQLRNQQTVTRWCREWSAAQSTPDAPQS